MKLGYEGSWVASVALDVLGRDTATLNLAAATVVFKAKVLHLVRGHEITTKAETKVIRLVDGAKANSSRRAHWSIRHLRYSLAISRHCSSLVPLSLRRHCR